MESRISYIDELLKESKEEAEIRERIDKEYDAFRNSDAHKAHKERLKALFDEMHEATRKRLENGENVRKRSRKKPVKLTEDEMAARWAEHEKIVAERRKTYAPIVRDTLNNFDNMSETEKMVFFEEFRKCHYGYHEIDKYENPKTTKKDISDLQDLLVQTTLDFINERKLTDIDSVSFSADSLQTSAKNLTWSSATDSYISVDGVAEKTDENTGYKYLIKERIGENF